MAAFADKDFNAEQYQSYRPSYPDELYDTIYKYHEAGGAQWNLCVDLGCGTGQSARTTASRLASVIGVDPSEAMIESARKVPQGHAKGGSMKYVVAPSEKLEFLEDASVDMITAATSCQYFKFPETWDEIRRVLKPNGTVAFFSYTAFQLGSPLNALNTYIDHCINSSSAMGPYRSQPGHDIVHTFLDLIPSPGQGFNASAEQRIKYIGEQFPLLHIENRQPVIIKASLPWSAIDGWFRTASYAHNYAKAHPEDKQNPEGDIMARLVKELKAEAEKMGFHENLINVETPMALLLFRKSA
ncbi:S-adenosyl-L-methionine-dependent methyltransferase [Dacryopinax primogenitus]|uniref:S-adenosyl-L-methionine-dependent methyltransferase n=1 Tax=Dacryopinax primogenitus (strain DJM 731) TaxID=1858805 RepID=M5FPT5_DACPD|nr:S-adenosyl-L-methionine-dependent methyltransferase [Dacryopinax primogenitus]EJT98765.1 S-adenosyl-L-methionine-dependent methyltransferase [Dacryopinax primogenitus]